MIPSPLGGASVQVESAGQLSHPVRLSLSDLLVTVGPYLNAEEHEQHLLHTAGAGAWVDLSLDEMRFAPKTGRIASLWFQVPELAVASASDAMSWFRVPRESGGLILKSGEDFELPSVRTRWCSPNGDVLVCLTGADSAERASRRRLRVAEDLELLLQDGEFAGWSLESPERHLSGTWDAPRGSARDTELGMWLAEYFSLVDATAVTSLEDGNAELIGELRRLAARVGSGTGGSHSRRQVVRESLEEVADWYS